MLPDKLVGRGSAIGPRYLDQRGLVGKRARESSTGDRPATQSNLNATKLEPLASNMHEANKLDEVLRQPTPTSPQSSGLSRVRWRAVPVLSRAGAYSWPLYFQWPMGDG
jgi:hypothetical protein